MRTSVLFCFTISALIAVAVRAQTVELHGGPIPEVRDGLSPADSVRIEAAIASDRAAIRGLAFTMGSEEPPRYPFVPQGGIVRQDLQLNNTVDLDPGPGIQDYDCTGYTYDGHRGHDLLISSFAVQAIGVPIFAALDGVVVDAHDGEPDTNTSLTNVPVNFVMLGHTGTHYTIYYHMRRGSVAVVKDQAVMAGTQLGLTGSSGNSNWPHLHFESRVSGVVYEPSAGPCRNGPSYWVSQAPLLREPFVSDFTFGTAPFDLYAPLPFDDAPRTGTFVHGEQTVYVRTVIPALPPSSTYEVGFLRPDGTLDSTSPGSFRNNELYRYSWWWFSFPLNLEPVGRWHFEMRVNGVNVLTAPFDVVGSSAGVVNRRPNPVTVSISPTVPGEQDVMFCRVSTALATRDPDYDIVRYRYEWTAGGHPVRSVTSAGLADALPRETALPGDVVTCSVTPTDGMLDGETASASVVYRAATPRRRSIHR